MNHGHQFDAALSEERKAEQERKQKEREARKRLEAAAPDLLDACKKIKEGIRFINKELPKEMKKPYQLLLQAIIKAEP